MSEGLTAIVLFLAEFSVRAAIAVYLLVRRRFDPATTLAWVIFILALPIVGLLAYFMFGEVRLGSRRAARHAVIVQRTRLAATGGPSSGRYPELPAHDAPIATLAAAAGGTEPLGGNQLRLIGKTDALLDALVEDIDAARDHCHLLFYIYMVDSAGERVAQALIRAAARGVTCRLLVDAVGSRSFCRSELRLRMERSGVRVVEALPASFVRMAFARLDLRNHRKLAVLDGRIGYTGSQNIADASFAIKKRYSPWVDAMVRIDGPVVRDLQELFIEDWFLDSDEALDGLLSLSVDARAGGVPVQIIGTGPNYYNEALRQVSQAAFHLAREELLLTTPYFVPDVTTATALCTAARRGVHTMLVVPELNDSPLVACASRAYYAALLEAGVEVHEYTKGLLHAKTMTVDRNVAIVSSANLDRRSFELNLEVSTIVYDSDFASELRFLQRSYMADSVQVDARAWKRRRWTKRLIENSAAMFGPLL